MSDRTVGETPAGLSSRIAGAFGQAFASLGRVRAKIWGCILLAVIVIVFLAQNSSPPMRLSFLIFGRFDVPFWAVAVILIALGFLLGYRRPRSTA